MSHIPCEATQRHIETLDLRAAEYIKEVLACPDTTLPWQEDPYLLPFNFRTPNGYRALQVFTDTIALQLAAAIPGSLPGMGVALGRESKNSPIGKFLAHFRQHLVRADVAER